MIDLHTHTNESDGSFTPSELIEAAARAGLRALAITDHDTFAGYRAAQKPALDAEIDLICGIEVSSKDGAMPVHILGYFLHSAPPDSFQGWLDSQIARRKERNIRLAAKLAELGINATLEEAEALGRTVTGRVHFARALVRKGYASSIQNAFERYLGEKAPGYVEANDPSIDEVLTRLRNAGAISSLAHPVRYGIREPIAEEQFIRRLIDAGLQALEVIHTDQNDQDVNRYSALAAKYGLLATGGSDFHGTAKPGVRLGYGSGGQREIPDEWLERMFASKTSLASLRQNYSRGELVESSVSTDPIDQFRVWFNDAENAGIHEPNAMYLATASMKSAPSVRTVLLKGVDTGFLFFTNYASHKAEDLAENPHAALCFHWKELERQVRIEGKVERVSKEESEHYFRARPRGSQLGAWASHQSRVIASREELERSYAEIERRFFDEEVPLPEFWGGYRLIPDSVEFWQGRPNRLHDRLLYERTQDGWTRKRLAP